MRDYGKVHTSFWSSETIRSMSEDGRTLALYLLTSPHATLAGVFRLPDGYVCEDLQWDSERVSKAFSETLSKGFANRCETTKWVWLSKYFEWNPPENPNQRKAAAKLASQIPDNCCWKSLFTKTCAKFLGEAKDHQTNPFETLPEPFRNQEQEQEQEKSKKDAPRRFIPPTLDDVASYCRERGNNVNPKKWLAHYEANGWKVGKNPMKDWRAAVRTWEQSDTPQVLYGGGAL